MAPTSPTCRSFTGDTATLACWRRLPFSRWVSSSTSVASAGCDVHRPCPNTASGSILNRTAPRCGYSGMLRKAAYAATQAESTRHRASNRRSTLSVRTRCIRRDVAGPNRNAHACAIARAGGRGALPLRVERRGARNRPGFRGVRRRGPAIRNDRALRHRDQPRAIPVALSAGIPLAGSRANIHAATRRSITSRPTPARPAT